MSDISSPQNERFKDLKALLESRGIKKQGRTLLSGRKLVEEFLKNHPSQVVEVISQSRYPELVEWQIPVTFFSNALFRELDVFGTEYPILVIAVASLLEWKKEPPQGLELIVPLSDPGNLGATLRSAEAFGVQRVILTEEACSPFLPKALRGAAGATFRLTLSRTGPLADIIQNVFTLDLHGDDLATFAWPENLWLALGEEGRGVPKTLHATPLSISMSTHSESLNATVAASIAMYSYRNRILKIK